MTEYPDLDEFFEPNLILPIHGVDYVIEPPSVVDVIRLRRTFADPERKATSLDRLDWQAKLLGAEWDTAADTYVGAPGSVWQQMIDDGVGGEEILRAGNTALLRFGINPELAGIYWGPDVTPDAEGKGPGSNRKARRAKPKKSSSKADTAATTPARAR